MLDHLHRESYRPVHCRHLAAVHWPQQHTVRAYRSASDRRIPPDTPVGLPYGATIYWGLDDRLKTPYSHVFDFSISREFPHNFVLETSYIGRLGRRLLQEEDLAMPLDIRDPKSGMDYFTAATMLTKAGENGVPIQNIAPIPFWENVFPGAKGTLLDNADLGCANGSSTFTGPTASATQAMYGLYSCFIHNETAALINTDVPGEAAENLPSATPGPGGCFPSCATLGGQVTPYAFFNPQFTSLYAWRNTGTSSYHGLQVTIRRGMTHGLQWDFNYTFSRSIDIGSNAERINQFDAFYQADQVINSWSPAQLRGVSDFDTTHQFNTNWVYQLPFGRGQSFAATSNRLLNGVIGGWQFSGLARWTSGFPTTIETFTSFPTNWELPSAAILSGPEAKDRSVHRFQRQSESVSKPNLRPRRLPLLLPRRVRTAQRTPRPRLLRHRHWPEQAVANHGIPKCEIQLGDLQCHQFGALRRGRLAPKHRTTRPAPGSLRKLQQYPNQTQSHAVRIAL